MYAIRSYYDQRILRGKIVIDEERSPEKNELKLIGLVRLSPVGRLEIRNRIYRQVFDRQWAQNNLTVSNTRQVAILTSMLAILAVIVAGFALYKQQRQPSLTLAEQFETSYNFV